MQGRLIPRSCKKNAVVIEPFQTWKVTYWEREYYLKFYTETYKDLYL